eukprot:CAMPEP_0172313690 /NCGR_PEP_ID=MMETSP1058-20130122/20773_1 /TAXON_ID=83371 /ORGANISM="Detonula confervacea, Strain CCMP 353" /LENGTH=793 /DNA_ID=CAMNT_0013027389 /DNA_START=15 /DNA_END=2396 /DNA_ORIENTATION=+
MTRSVLLLSVLATTLFSLTRALSVTLPIITFRLDLTLNGRNRGRNLRRERNDEHDLDEQRSLQSIDSTIQSLAESHLSTIYSDEFSITPSQVLLTVVTDDIVNAAKNGIYIRSSFLGGVVSFPTDDGLFNNGAPSRSELERVTLHAFSVPGLGEPFLKALGEEDHEELEGLLLISATEVKKGYNDAEDSEGDSTAAAGQAAAPATLDDGGGDSMNIWAVAAVAALGAMFLVIIMCTSILYCDWRKRKERRERKRERQAAATMANGNASGSIYRSAVSKKGSGKSVDLHVDVGDENYQHDNQDQRTMMQIVVPAAASGETEEMNASPSSSNEFNNEGMNNANNNNNGFNPPSSSRTAFKMSNIVKKVVKSKAANSHLQQANNNSEARLSQDYQNLENQADYIPETTPSIADYSVGEDTTMLYPTINRHRACSKDNMSDFDGYSMDGMSAVDGGYSQFGGSGGGSNMDGNNNGIHSSKKSRDMYYTGDVPRDFDSVWGDDESKLTVDGMTTDGSVDFTPAKQTRRSGKNEASAGGAPNKEAYADLNQSLNKLIEHEYEESSHSNTGEQSTVNLNEFDSESDSGSNRGAFTLELLRKKPSPAKRNASLSSAAPSSADDDDSILGKLYRDETSELGVGLGEEESSSNGEQVPGSGDSVDSTPSWAAPIQSALRNSVSIFRTSSRDDKEEEDVASVASKESQEQRTNSKFVSSLNSDDGSVGSSRSRGSTGNNGTDAANSRGGTTRKETTAKSSEEKVLGLTNSMEEEVDEDPAAMIDNINSMLSECREILDTDQSAV